MTNENTAALLAWYAEYAEFWGDVITDPDALRRTFTELTEHYAALGVDDLGLPAA